MKFEKRQQVRVKHYNPDRGAWQTTGIIVEPPASEELGWSIDHCALVRLDSGHTERVSNTRLTPLT